MSSKFTLRRLVVVALVLLTTTLSTVSGLTPIGQTSGEAVLASTGTYQNTMDPNQFSPVCKVGCRFIITGGEFVGFECYFDCKF